MDDQTRKRWLVIGAVFLTIAMFWLGLAMGTRLNRNQLAAILDDTQVEMAFNRLLEERKLESLLSKDCKSAALEKIRISIDQDMKLLASFEGKVSPGMAKYINDRDPTLLNNLKEFKSKYGNSWIEPDCPKSQT